MDYEEDNERVLRALERIAEGIQALRTWMIGVFLILFVYILNNIIK